MNRARRLLKPVSAAWNWLARLRLVARWPVKWALLAAVVLFALYPRPGLFLEQIRHLSNVESLIQPELPQLAEINREISATLKPDATPREEFRAVERYVYNRIRYEYDWFNWGNRDYWPTTQEVLERQREDCDGRAVLAASLLRARGFATATVVGNLNHVWVQVDKTELMGPQKDRNFQRVGGKLVISLPQQRTVLASAAMIRKFPSLRSLLIMAAVLVLAYHPCRNLTGLLALATLALAGFVLFLGWADRFDDDAKSLLLGPLSGALALLLGALTGALLANRVLSRRPKPASQQNNSIAENQPAA